MTWGAGGIQSGTVRSLLDEVRDGVLSVMAGRQPAEEVYFYRNGDEGGYHRFDWIRLGKNRFVFMLRWDKPPAREVN